jgi:hypothetical protein
VRKNIEKNCTVGDTESGNCFWPLAGDSKIKDFFFDTKPLLKYILLKT